MPESSIVKHSEKANPIEPPATLTMAAGILFANVAISLIRRGVLSGDGRISFWVVAIPDVLGVLALIYLTNALLRLRSHKRQVFSEIHVSKKQLDFWVASGLSVTTMLIWYFQTAKIPAWIVTYAPYNLPIVLLVVFSAALWLAETRFVLRRDESLAPAMLHAEIICADFQEGGVQK